MPRLVDGGGPNPGFLRAVTGGCIACGGIIGTGKSGIVPIDEFVDCLEDGVIGDVMTGDSSLPLYLPWLFTLMFCSVCCGLY